MVVSAVRAGTRSAARRRRDRLVAAVTGLARLVGAAARSSAPPLGWSPAAVGAPGTKPRFGSGAPPPLPPPVPAPPKPPSVPAPRAPPDSGAGGSATGGTEPSGPCPGETSVGCSSDDPFAVGDSAVPTLRARTTPAVLPPAPTGVEPAGPPAWFVAPRSAATAALLSLPATRSTMPEVVSRTSPNRARCASMIGATTPLGLSGSVSPASAAAGTTSAVHAIAVASRTSRDAKRRRIGPTTMPQNPPPLPRVPPGDLTVGSRVPLLVPLPGEGPRFPRWRDAAWAVRRRNGGG